MKLIRIRCLVCLAWHSPIAHKNHCPFCGAYRVGRKHYAMSAACDTLRELVSGVHMPLALRHNYFTR